MTIRNYDQTRVHPSSEGTPGEFISADYRATFNWGSTSRELAEALSAVDLYSRMLSFASDLLSRIEPFGVINVANED